MPHLSILCTISDVWSSSYRITDACCAEEPGISFIVWKEEESLSNANPPLCCLSRWSKHDLTSHSHLSMWKCLLMHTHKYTPFFRSVDFHNLFLHNVISVNQLDGISCEMTFHLMSRVCFLLLTFSYKGWEHYELAEEEKRVVLFTVCRFIHIDNVLRDTHTGMWLSNKALGYAVMVKCQWLFFLNTETDIQRIRSFWERQGGGGVCGRETPSGGNTGMLALANHLHAHKPI